MRDRYQPSVDPRRIPEAPEGHYWCSRCKAFKPEAEFYASQIGKTGHGLYCKDCYRARHLEQYAPKHGTTREPRPCAYCGEAYQPKTRRVSKYCSRECAEADRKESGRGRNTYLLRTYGITADDYDRMLAEQGGGCALCGVKPDELTAGRYRTYLHVDHCHDTQVVRGLLCPEHNLLLGRFGDSVDMFRKVVTYLEAHASP